MSTKEEYQKGSLKIYHNLNEDNDLDFVEFEENRFYPPNKANEEWPKSDLYDKRRNLKHHWTGKRNYYNCYFSKHKNHRKKIRTGRKWNVKIY